MEYVKPETVNAIKSDEFARKAIESIRDLIYSVHRDWNATTLDGKLLFDDDKWGVAYLALCCLIDNMDEPAVEGKVMISGQAINASCIQILTKELRNNAASKKK